MIPMVKMPIFGLKSILNLLNLYKIGNLQKDFNYHVIKFISITHNSKSIVNKRKKSLDAFASCHFSYCLACLLT
jgi:hypothetical protein